MKEEIIAQDREIGRVEDNPKDPFRSRAFRLISRFGAIGNVAIEQRQGGCRVETRRRVPLVSPGRKDDE